MKLVKIKWRDSRGVTESWEEISYRKKLKLCKIKSVGYLLNETKKYIEITPHLSENKYCCGNMCIPKCSIIKIKVIK